MPPHADECTLDQATQVVACAGRGKIWTLKISPNGEPRLMDVVDTGHPIRAVAIDQKTGWMWTVWAGPSGDFVQAYKER